MLDRYRESSAYQVMRTDTVGRVKKQGGWSIDFGIAPGERDDPRIVAGADDCAAGRRAGALGVACGAAQFEPSEMFLRMQLSPGSCFDDGDLRDW